MSDAAKAAEVIASGLRDLVRRADNLGIRVITLPELERSPGVLPHSMEIVVHGGTVDIRLPTGLAWRRPHEELAP